MTKLKLNFKIFFFINILIVCLIFSTKLYADTLKINKNVVSIGASDAKVKIKIFSSFTCPHCANFHNKIYPKIKKEFVDSGKVQLIFIDFPLDQAAFNASKLLHCTEKNKQINFLDFVYEKQNQWIKGPSIKEVNKNLEKIAKDFGISKTQFEKCLVNEKISDKILNARILAVKNYDISSTPTIIINEKKIKSPSFKNIKKIIEKII